MSNFPLHGCLSARLADQFNCAKNFPEILFFTITAIYRGFNVWLHQERVFFEVAVRFSSFDFGDAVEKKVMHTMAQCDRLIKNSILLQLNSQLNDAELLCIHSDGDVGSCSIYVCDEAAFRDTGITFGLSIKKEHIAFEGPCSISAVENFDEWREAVEELEAPAD
ncbi:MAG: hypothetical protein LBH53_02035 [Puniceicoccales bacterium]|nr:hypothetical protein [Puniceicoccales bacterium]